jgi:hypothetical protein
MHGRGLGVTINFLTAAIPGACKHFARMDGTNVASLPLIS